MRRALRIGLALCAFAAAAVGVWTFFHDRGADHGELVLLGNVDVRQVNLAFKVPGRIAEMQVDEGDSVKRGQAVAALEKVYFEDEVRAARARVDVQRAVLAELVNGTRPEEIDQARARVAERRAALTNAQIAHQRQEELLRRANTSRQAYDNALAALRESEAQLALAEATLRLAEAGPRAEDIEGAEAELRADEAALVAAERRLADAELIAPNDGVILTRVRERGAIVAAGETVYALTLTTPVWVRTYVGEPDLGRVRPGLVAEVQTDSGDKVYRGRVGFISPTAEFTPKSVETRELRTSLVYRLRVVVEDPDGGLRQGMPVTVTLRPAATVAARDGR